MRIRPVVVAYSLLALGAPVVAAAQPNIPAGIRQRAVEVGVLGRYTIFSEDDYRVDPVFAGGGRLGIFIWRNLAVEGEVSFGVTKPSVTPSADSLDDVSHTLWDARLVYNTPQRGRTSFMIGAGYGYDGFGRLRDINVGPRGHGPSGLVGVRFYMTPRVSLRADVGGLYVIEEDEPRRESSVQSPEGSRFAPSIRLGLSALFRNTAGDVSTTTTTVMQAGRVDTVRVPGPTRTIVDTVYRERITQATQGTATGGGSGATVVIGVVNFDFDKADLSSDARRILDDVATSLTRPEAQRLRLIVTGNTDAIGGESYNNRLSERRAAAVADYLATRGIGSDRMERRAAGEGNPVASNNNPEGRATNRRVLIELANQ